MNRDVADAGVEPDRDPSGVQARELVDDLGILDGRAPHDHAVHAGREPVTGVVDRAHTTTALHPHVDVGTDRFDHSQVCLAAVARGVEIDDVDPPRALRGEVTRDRDGIVAVNRFRVVVAAEQAHDLPFEHVDRRVQVHGHAAAAADAVTKFPSIARPTSPLFSGWNCVAHNGPCSIAAANRRP